MVVTGFFWTWLLLANRGFGFGDLEATAMAADVEEACAGCGVSARVVKAICLAGLR